MQKLKLKIHNLLRRSERIFKTDMIYLMKGGSWLGFGQIVSALSALIVALLFANLIPKEVYGTYKYVLSISSILAALWLSGVGTVITQGVAQGAEGVLKDSVKTSLRWGLLIVVASIITAAYYFSNDNSVVAICILIAGINLPLCNTYGLFGNYLTGKKDFKRSTLYNTYSQLFITVALVITALATKNVVAMVAAYFIADTVSTIAIYKYVLLKFPPNDIKDNTLVPYSKHLSLIGFFGTVANQMDDILIFHYLGAVDLAIYSFSQAIPEQLKGAFKNLFGLALPKYATLSIEDMRKSIMKKFASITGLTVIIVLVYIVAAPFIFQLLFPKYMASVFYSQIYMISLITIPGISLFGTYFQLRKATKILYKLNFIGNITTIFFTFILIYKYGLNGAVIENSISWSIILLSNWYYFAKDTSWKEEFKLV